MTTMTRESDTRAQTVNPFLYRRRRTRVVMVGDVAVGGNNPIRVQSMTTTRTQDVEATAAQAERLVRAGCEIVRITAPTVRDAKAIGEIRAMLRAKGITVPLVADIHFSPEAALAAADVVEKVRINPGNYADSRKFAVREYTDAEYVAELTRIEASPPSFSNSRSAASPCASARITARSPTALPTATATRRAAWSSLRSSSYASAKRTISTTSSCR